MTEYHFDLDLDQKVYDMTVSQKQTLEIVKVLLPGRGHSDPRRTYRRTDASGDGASCSQVLRNMTC